jgi:hypothetical protein
LTDSGFGPGGEVTTLITGKPVDPSIKAQEWLRHKIVFGEKNFSIKIEALTHS